MQTRSLSTILLACHTYFCEPHPHTYFCEPHPHTYFCEPHPHTLYWITDPLPLPFWRGYPLPSFYWMRIEGPPLLGGREGGEPLASTELRAPNWMDWILAISLHATCLVSREGCDNVASLVPFMLLESLLVPSTTDVDISPSSSKMSWSMGSSCRTGVR